ncbi:S8 family serine peptidase [Hymenobacter weizhouensis]|uniref:S8 family serine peptidase n=1 Tax=Hymenobacter sp. YIM 151500-1 TaxID=2987689 RepID=UPI0022277C1D|nr:S8 family serine peptidase [Hymenobacter sp. YIM 151500-1]UYZ62285.1 S8 family serine peptidase [Hymenobacter sp. YIM 151500-1]
MKQTLSQLSTSLKTAWSAFVLLVCLGHYGQAQVAEPVLPPDPGQRTARLAARPQTQKATGKVSAELLELSQQAQAGTSRRGAAFKPANPYLQVRNGSVVVNITAQGDAQQLANELKGSVGLTNAAVAQQLISGSVPISNLRKLGAHRQVRFVRAAYKPRLKVGRVTSQGDKAQRSDVARQVAGVSGLGVKVGVLSDSYNRLNGAAAGIASGDLPGPGNPTGRTKPVQVLQELPAEDEDFIDEGRAMLEIVHDVAPDAELAFHTAFEGGEANFAQAILNLADAGCQVIVDDILFVDEPYFSDGVSAKAIDQVKSKGVSFFTAVGNFGRDSYESPFRASAFEPLGPGTGTAHNFSAPGQRPRYYQPVIIPKGGVFAVPFQWDDAFFSVTGDTTKQARTDLDIYLLNDSLRVVAASATNNLASGDPIEFLVYANTDRTNQNEVFYVVITKSAGPDPNRVKYIQFGTAAFPRRTSPPVPGIFAGTAFGHVTAAGAISVGAAFYQDTPPFGTTPPVHESFSSYSRIPIYFDANGNRFPRPVVRLKPEITAPDGANTTFFPPVQVAPLADSDVEGDGFPNFFGTSASAPHAAGVAALMIEAFRNPLPPDLVKLAMTSTALDMDDEFTNDSTYDVGPNADPAGDVFDQGFDFTTGYGLLQADRAVRKVTFRPPFVIDLRFSPVCSANPAAERRWRILNYNPFRVKVRWTVSGTTQQGVLVVPPGESFFSTAAVSGPNTVTIAWTGANDRPQTSTRTSTGTQCNPGTLAAKGSLPDEEQPAEPAIVTTYPNPFRQELNVLLSGGDHSPASVKLYNATGELVYDQALPDGTAGKLDLSRLPAGLYLAHIKQGQFPVKVLKLVKE